MDELPSACFYASGLNERNIPLDDLPCPDDLRNGDACRHGDILRQGIEKLHARLSGDRSFDDLLHRALHSPPLRQRSWTSHCLIRTTGLWSGLVVFYRFSPVLPHDHPNSSGIQMVISGKLRITQYTPSLGHTETHPLVMLERTQEKELTVGETSFFTPRYNNIHRLHALTSRCAILSLIIDPWHTGQRSWYLPVTLSGSGRRSLYRPVAMPGPANTKPMDSC